MTSVSLLWLSDTSGDRGRRLALRSCLPLEPLAPVRWLDFLEVCAAGEETTVQIAGTTIHELAHCLAGNTAGHGPQWKAACKVLGLIHAEAAGQAYAPEHFAPDVWADVEALSKPNDGRPTVGSRGAGGPGIIARPVTVRPCPLGIGTRGGRSRGAGSGSRLRLWQCSCGVKVRIASDDFRAQCLTCGTVFKRADPTDTTGVA